ncbi:MAG: nucleoside hydrolase [Candidatus Omnitrophica bacterium]|nr:nucleoside hydrolase [Candidatus Omnitrophota bacterium]
MKIKAQFWASLLLLFALATWTPSTVDASESARIPVIYDSDIGDDIDDTWALGLLLRSPEVDLKLVVGDQGKTEYRAKLFAKLLERAGRTDVPIGMGLDVNAQGGGRQSDWVKDYDLQSYPGKIHPDGVQAIIDTIMNSPEPITLIAVGPLPNIAEALKREPRIAQKAKFVGMHGSVRLGYGGSPNISAEYNVRADAKACQKVFTAPWEMTITPLDTCGLVVLEGERYAKVRDSKNPIAAAIIENYRIWNQQFQNSNPETPNQKSSTLFDTVAVYLAFNQDFCQMENLGIRVTDDGYTKIDPSAKVMKVASEWINMDAFKDLLVNRITEN